MELKLRYLSPAADSAEGWERESLPLGNGWFGGRLFGIVARERFQITENSLLNQGAQGGLNNFAELYFRFPHHDVSGYERCLDLDHGCSVVSYEADGVLYRRTAFASYPDHVLAIRFTASVPGALSFTAAPEIPYLTDDPEREKTGEVKADGNTITLAGHMENFNLYFEGQLRLFTDGTMTADGGTISVTGATEATALFTCGTNYVLRPEVFTIYDAHQKLPDVKPHERISALMEAASAFSWEKLLERHEADYRALFGRVSLNFGEDRLPDLPTDELLRRYREGERSHYLEALYVQYGRYLLISSSRKGTLPANLQGVWNVHDRSPWGAGYWHNINVQMNYWPAFSANLAETFEAYRAFYEAYRPQAGWVAGEYIRRTQPDSFDPDEDYGWAVGTSCFCVALAVPGKHSGPGTGALTSKLFWELYDFTRDEEVLRRVTYPALLGMARFLSHCVKDYDGKYLSFFSASPEQLFTMPWGWPNNIPDYQTVGCSFDQQMIYENAHDLLRCVDILGEDTLPEEDLPLIAKVREQADRYDPIQVGWSGQIKEYREERFYGDIGEYHHRHISHLMALFPCSQITSETPAWRDAAAVSLDRRGDKSTGWALAHRLNAWARTCDGNRAYRLLSNLIAERTAQNLWDLHPPFQIDGNFGGTSGVTEMLLQSHETYIAPLPALPDDWPDGSFTGLVARGNFVVDAAWRDGSAVSLRITSRKGGTCRVKLPGVANGVRDFEAEAPDGDRLVFETVPGGVYTVSAIPAREKRAAPSGLRVSRSLELTWTSEGPVSVWRAQDSDPVYTLLAPSVTGGSFLDETCDFASHDTVTYKITAAGEGPDAPGDRVTANHSTLLDRERRCHIVRQLNEPANLTLTPGDWE